MNILEFKNLYQIDYSVSGIFAMKHCWKENECFSMMSYSRPTNALLYFLSCECEYSVKDGGSFYVNKGDLIYIPQGSEYTCKFIKSDSDVLNTLLIEFVLTDISGELFVLNPSVHIIDSGHCSYYEKMFGDVIEEYSKPMHAPAMLKSLVYKTLTDISQNQRRNDILKVKYKKILPSINYMEESIEQDMSIPEIARLSNVSTNYFEKLFKDYSGMTPIEYRLNSRLEYAKRLLKNDELSVESISEILGFSDCAYFCRIFKKKIGMTPREYSRL